MHLVLLIILALPGQLFAEELALQAMNKCAACHSLKEGEHKAGPSLFKLSNRKAGSVKGFKFSKALRKSGIVWDAETLDAYLKDPMGYIPRNRMAFAGLKNDEERAALVCYLLEKDC